METVEELALLVAVLALSVSVLTLLAVPDLGMVWRRLRVIGVVAAFLVVAMVAAAAVQEYVLPVTSRFIYLPDGMVLPFLAGLALLGAVAGLWDYLRGRHRRGPPVYIGPTVSGRDPGDYKIGW